MVKISLDPMPALRGAAIDKLNQKYTLMFQDPFRQIVHARKREIATNVKNGQVAPNSFMLEANMRGLTTEDFADLVLSKVSDLDQMELERQQVLAKIKAATTLAELEELVGEIR